MSLGRPDRGSVDDKDRLFQILTGLYDAINGTRTSITQLEQRIVTVTDASTTINTGTSSSAVSPLGFDREDGDGADGGPAPGSTSSTNMARVWVSTPDTAFPNGVNMGALGDGTIQQTVTAGVATPTAFAGTTGSIPFYAANSQLAQDNTNLFFNNSTKALTLGGDVNLIRSGSQSFNKTTTGTLFIGTDVGGDSVSLYTAGTSRLTIDNAARITFGASDVFFDETSRVFSIGNASPGATIGFQYNKSVNQGVIFGFSNPSVGGSAYTSYILGRDAAFTAGYAVAMFSSGSTFGAPYGVNTVCHELYGGNGPMNFWIDQASGDFRWYTGTTFPGPPERMRLAWGGLLSVDPGGLLTSGTSQSIGTTTSHNDWITNTTRSRNGGVYHTISNTNTGTTASGGYVVTQSASGYGTNLVYLLLQSSGFTTAGVYTANSAILEHVTATATAPLIFSAAGPQNIDFYTTAGYARRLTINNGGTVEVVSQLHIDVSADQVWRNLGAVGAGTYEQVRAFWTSNTFVLATETAGGTERNMVLGNATTATVTVGSGTLAQLTSGSGSSQIVYAAGLRVGMIAAPTITSAASAVLDAIQFGNPDTVSVTGTTNITTATGFNYAVIKAPTYNGGGSAKTITSAATLMIEGPPVGASGVTITNAYGLWVQGGLVEFAGNSILCGNGQTLGFFGGTGTTKQTPAGSRGGNAALASLLTALAAYGLITDGTSA